MPPPPFGPEYWLAIRQDGALGKGTPTDPLDVSSPTLFASVMNSLPANSTIRLGPGIFQTFGFIPVGAGNWQPKSGQRIIGAGRSATTLKVVGAISPVYLTLAIGNDPAGNFLDGFEASDLTVDCNMRGHTGKGVAIGAIAAQGRRIRLRRIRAIDFGTEAAPGADWVECFVIAAGGASPDRPEAYDSVIEDCLIDHPYRGNTGNTTCTIFFAGEDANGWPAYHRACVVRRCCIDCEYRDNEVPISGIVRTGVGNTTALVATKIPHNRQTGQWVAVTGALVETSPGVPSLNNPFVGSFPITVLNSTQFQYTMVSDPGSNPTGDMWIGRVTPHPIGVRANKPPILGNEGVVVQDIGGGQYSVTIYTEKPHLLAPQQRTLVNGVRDANDLPLALINGLQLVTEVPTPTTLKYLVNANPGDPFASQPKAYLGSSFVGISADAGVGAIVEDNRVFNVTWAIYRDTWSTKDISIRKNYFHAVASGIYSSADALDPHDAAGKPARVPMEITHSGNIATLRTVVEHGLLAGEAIAVDFATPVGYNGNFTILSVPDPKSMTYKMASTPASNASGAKWAFIWQAGRVIVEGNIIELIVSPMLSNFGSPFALLFWGANRVNPYGFGQVAVRRNLIRNVDSASDTQFNSYALRLDSSENAIVARNDISLSLSTSIRQHNTCGKVNYFTNMTPGGGLVQAYLQNEPNSQSVNELATDLEAAISLLTAR